VQKAASIAIVAPHDEHFFTLVFSVKRLPQLVQKAASIAIVDPHEEHFFSFAVSI